MKYLLPEKLSDAELLLHKSITLALKKSTNKLISTNILFNNIRLNPIINRLYKSLLMSNYNSYLIWPDAGATALAKRDMQDIADNIFSYREFGKISDFNEDNKLLIAISPQPYDYDEFQEICSKYLGPILMFNGKLEDTAVGIGTIGRERRKDFIYSWHQIFWLQPLSKGAIMKEYNKKWILFKLYQEGYKFCAEFNDRPDEESITEALL